MEVTNQFFILVSLIIGVVEVFKRAGLNIRYAPIVGLALGIFGAYFIEQLDKIVPALIVGIYFIVTRYISYRKKSFGHNHE